jgi:predicted ATP-grasp superfamily ATP-dependent carboligase
MDDEPGAQVDDRNHGEAGIRARVRIHVYEFVTGGGLAGAELPASLRREGELMRDALLADLLELPGIDLSISVDPRCPLPHGAAIRSCGCDPTVGDPEGLALARAVAASDAVWIVAPESGGALARAAAIVGAAGKRLLGAQPAAIDLASSKARTAARLQQHGIAVAPVFDLAAARATPDAARTAWALKPDDGAGCSETWRCDGIDEAVARAEHLGAGFIVQRWIDGPALSLSAVTARGVTELLSVNRQVVSLDRGEVRLDALMVNSISRDTRYRELARAVAEAVPGLEGYFGVDLVVGASGATVIEINPRLTTSYAGLRRARSINVAARVLGHDAAVAPDFTDVPVRIDLAGEIGAAR